MATEDVPFNVRSFTDPLADNVTFADAGIMTLRVSFGTAPQDQLPPVFQLFVLAAPVQVAVLIVTEVVVSNKEHPPKAATV